MQSREVGGQQAAARRRRQGLPGRPRLCPAPQADATRRAASSSTTRCVFLPQDGNFTSTGVVKVPDADPAAGPAGAVPADRGGRRRARAALDLPRPGRPRAVPSAVDRRPRPGRGRAAVTSSASTPTAWTSSACEALRPGETWTLPDGAGTRGVRRPASAGRRSPSRTTPARSWPCWPRCRHRRPDALAVRATPPGLGAGRGVAVEPAQGPAHDPAGGASLGRTR